MLYGEKMDAFQESLASANYEQLLLSSQVMICELVRRHLVAQQKSKESHGTDKQRTQLVIASAQRRKDKNKITKPNKKAKR
jgi:hypothetical protein